MHGTILCIVLYKGLKKHSVRFYNLKKLLINYLIICADANMGCVALEQVPDDAK